MSAFDTGGNGRALPRYLRLPAALSPEDVQAVAAELDRLLAMRHSLTTAEVRHGTGFPPGARWVMAGTDPEATAAVVSAARWMVKIWAGNDLIERGSALWEDIERLRAAVAVLAATEGDKP